MMKDPDLKATLWKDFLVHVVIVREVFLVFVVRLEGESKSMRLIRHFGFKRADVGTGRRNAYNGDGRNSPVIKYPEYAHLVKTQQYPCPFRRDIQRCHRSESVQLHLVCAILFSMKSADKHRDQIHTT